MTTTLHYDGSAMPTTFTHVRNKICKAVDHKVHLQAVYEQQTLMDEFEYVCSGRVFKVKDAPDSKLQVRN